MKTLEETILDLLNSNIKEHPIYKNYYKIGYRRGKALAYYEIADEILKKMVIPPSILAKYKYKFRYLSEIQIKRFIDYVNDDKNDIIFLDEKTINKILEQL